MKHLIAKFGGVIAMLALAVTTGNTNQACMLVLHQPELPKGAEKLRKF